MKKQFVRFLSILMTLSLVLALPIQALAEEYDLSVGSITVTASEGGQSVTQVNGVTNEKQTTATVITQTWSDTAFTSNTITITGSGEAAVTLNNVNIYTSGTAVKVDDGVDATVTLEGDNKVESGYEYAGVAVETGAALTIDGSGSLDASGGGFAAGIGGGNYGDGGQITINGGVVTATGGDYGAGIGGGYSGDGGEITINNGTVTATSERAGAGIGGGYSGDGGEITINNGTVTASGGSTAAGIGGGYSGDGGKVTINDGAVTAIGGNYGAGIGGGFSGNGANVTITGGQVSATGLMGASHIGGGAYSSSNGTLDHGDVELYLGEPLPEPEPVPEPDPDPVPVTDAEQAEDIFWQDVLKQIQAAANGALTVDIGQRAWIPVYILEALGEYNVTLTLTRDGVDPIILTPSVEFDSTAWSVPLDTLA